MYYLGVHMHSEVMRRRIINVPFTILRRAAILRALFFDAIDYLALSVNVLSLMLSGESTVTQDGHREAALGTIFRTRNAHEGFGRVRAFRAQALVLQAAGGCAHVPYELSKSVGSSTRVYRSD